MHLNRGVRNINALSIGLEEARQIEAISEPIRKSVAQMFAAYRPGLGDGNGQSEALPVETLAKVIASPIVRKDGDENSASFWNLFASGTGDRMVEKATAIFVASKIVDEVIGGGRGNQAIVSFKGNEPIIVADVLAVIERLCGGSPAGWQRVQRKAGIKL